MQLKALLADDDAVSPVIGVILMVAITVILAAVIGSFVLGLGNQVSEAQPSPTLGFNYSDANSDTTAVGITHDGGDSLDQSNINISIGGTVYWNQGDSPAGVTLAGGDVGIVPDSGWNSTDISATDQIVIHETGNTETFGQGDDVNVIWSSESGDTAVLAEGTIN